MPSPHARPDSILFDRAASCLAPSYEHRTLYIQVELVVCLLHLDFQEDLVHARVASQV